MWRAMAMMCGGQLVEAPSALAATIAFSNASRVMMSDGRQVLVHHVDDALAGLVGHLAALAIRRGDGRAAGQRHAQRLGQLFIESAVPMVLQWPTLGARGRHHLHELFVVDLARPQALARRPRRWCRSPPARHA